MRDTGDPPPDPGDGARAATKVLFGKYEVGRLLGCGAFAKVYHARHTPSGQSVALKVLSTARLLRAGLAHAVLREVAAMRRLRHPHVLRLHEVLATRSRVYLVLELARGGELFDRLASSGRLSEPAARTLFRQLLSALAFCHARGVFHRDLKPENLLLDDAGRLKVSDFGLAALAPAAAPLLRTLCGTPAYVAPEILAKKAYDGAKSDLWSSGVVLFVLTAGYLPFNDPNLMSLYRKIYRGDFRCPRWTSPELRHLISRLLDTNPETRITVDEIIRHPWFRDGLTDADLAAMMRLHEDLEFKEKVNSGAEEAEERELNAFDIISFSSGFDLSGLFGAVPARQRFVSHATAEAAMQCVEELVLDEGLAVRGRTGSKAGRGAAVVERPGGEAVAWVEVYRLAGGLVLVEVEMVGAIAAGANEGGRRWSGDFWMERLGPALNRTTEPVSIRSGSSVERSEPIGEED